MMGWIKLHRTIMKHWVFQDAEYFRAWCIILMQVNHEPKKVLIHGKIYECERGQSLLSLNSWVKEFGVNKWSIQKVRTFFKLLEKDKMINIEGSNKTTRITVCNYDDYQNNQQADNTQLTIKQHAPNTHLTTTKELKNDKNDKEEKNIYVNSDIDSVYKQYPTKCPVNSRALSKSQKDKNKIKTLLKKHTAEELIKIIQTYIEECKRSKTYVKNFSTFLNNLPDYEEQGSYGRKTITTKQERENIEKYRNVKYEERSDGI